MRRMASAKVASAAVTHTQLAVEDELGWLFRAQPTEDYGIDPHAEVVDGEDVRGRLLALQIKGGVSWFAEPRATLREAAEGGWCREPRPRTASGFQPADGPSSSAAAPVSSIAFRPDGRTLAIGGRTDNHPVVRLWDIASGHVTILRGQEKRVSSVAFSRDGKYLASVSDDSSIRIWKIP